VVSYGDDGHAQTLAAVIYVLGIVVRFIAKVADERSGDPAGCFCMDVEVASHAAIVARGYEQSVKRLQIVGKCVVATY
jgi:hypothetical protein